MLECPGGLAQGGKRRRELPQELVGSETDRKAIWKCNLIHSKELSLDNQLSCYIGIRKKLTLIPEGSGGNGCNMLRIRNHVQGQASRNLAMRCFYPQAVSYHITEQLASITSHSMTAIMKI